MKIGAVILCGGESRRMGEPKAWLPFGDEFMLQRLIRLVRPSVQSIVVVAATGQELPEIPASVVVVRDSIARRGPLQGLATGLAALPEEVELAYATGTDVPFFQPAWIARLRELIGEDDMAIPFAEGYHHPLASLYRKSTILPAVEALLREDRLRPFYLLEAVRARIVSTDEMRSVDPDLKTLRNLNTPEHYRSALDTLLREAGG
jgi:molybdopterin-guanine dinucleotide biosynthesis protein A